MTVEIQIIRKQFTPQNTIGDWIWFNHIFCQTLEDTVREPGIKIPGQTAIPAGRYELRLTYSNRFKQVMPQLMNVPMYEGIRIHPGNTELHTDGCILVGKQDGHKLINSRDTYNDLMDELEKTKQTMFVTIINQRR